MRGPIREELRGKERLEWITALRAPSIRRLVDSGSLQLSLFDTTDMAEIRDPSYPDERLIVCRNPLLAAERARKREDLLRATEKDLDKIVQATMRSERKLNDEVSIRRRVDKALAPLLFEDHRREKVSRVTAVAPARRSQAAQDKVKTQRTEEGVPVTVLAPS